MPAVISNTSPLQYLHQVDLLPLLPALFGQVCAPTAVAGELATGRSMGLNLPNPEALAWIDVRNVSQRGLLPEAPHLGEGEKEVIALALEQQESLLLLDDRIARIHAHALNLSVTGTLGILLLAKERGLLHVVRPALDQLDALQFRLDERTRRHVLKLAGESN